jgi:hypothetical protein
LKGGQDFLRKHTGAAKDPAWGDKREEDRAEESVDMLRRNGGQQEIGLPDAEGPGKIDRFAEEV